MKIRVHFVVFLFVATLFAGLAEAADSVTYPPIKLRGYGTLSGTFTQMTAGGHPESYLRIRCDDSNKAKLVQAKFISDLQVLPGLEAIQIPIDARTSSGTIPGYRASNGTFLVVQDGKSVIIYCAASPEAVVQMMPRGGETARSGGEGAFGRAFRPQAAIPMYLNRFDKFSFRFYYGPFVVPEGTKQLTDYDPTQDFAYAKQVHAGMQFWHTPLSIDNAEGITNMPWTLWALKAANKDALPVGINDGIESKILWAHNRWPEQMAQFQPGFLGDWYGSMNFDEGITSWNGLEAKDHELGELQDSLRKLSAYKNITTWLEPHEEMSHGVADLLLEYGPVADAGYRTFLKEKYGDVSTVSKRWYGDSSKLKSWNDVHSPELADFLGWGPDALDLTGTWKISYDQPFGPEAGSTSLDDSSWPTSSSRAMRHRC